ncbi:MAG: dienelactone hydrolase family protein [Candidatus Hydrogenedentes bacterium]|nr:dienelactone hydrolase family protein [Candidatus Hydrogenedentota bacterium]
MTQDSVPAYSVVPYMRKRFDRLGRKLRFGGTTPAEAQAWRRAARKKLRELIGLDTMTACPLKPRVTERVDCGDYVRERIEIQVEPLVVMPLYMLIPKTGKKSYATILCPHGHGFGAKAGISGAGGHPDIEAAFKLYNADYGRVFCRAGFVTLCPDARGFGERQERAAAGDVLNSSCNYLNHMAIPLGQTVTGMWVHDLQRLIDYAATRPECDMSRLGCAGLSGGGLQTLWLTALDERIKAAIDSGYFYGVKESLLDLYENCSCNYVPHLWEYVVHGDLGALIAPRPLMVQTGDEDPLNGASKLKNVTPQLGIARKTYKVLGAAKHLQHDVFHGQHRWDNAHTVPFMVKYLKP